MQITWCTRRQPPQLLADDVAAAPADADVDLVEDERGHLVGRGEDGLERQHDARRLAAGGDPGQRLERLAGVGRDQELHAVDAGRVEGVAARSPISASLTITPSPAGVLVDGHLEAHVAHVEVGQLLLQPPGDLVAGGAPGQREGGRLAAPISCRSSSS